MSSHFATLLLTVAIALSTSELRAGDEASKFPLLGLWSLVSEEKDGQKVHSASDGLEIEFRRDGTMIVTAQIRWAAKLQQMGYSYSFSPPNVIISTLNGKEYEKQQFSLEGETLTLQGTNQRKSILRRITHTELIEAPLSATTDLKPSNKGRKPSDSASDTARNAYLVMNDGTAEEMKAFYSKDYAQALGELPTESQKLMTFDAQSNLVTQGHAVTSVEVIDVAYPEYGASVKLRLHYKFGGTRVYNADFKKEAGVWKFLYY